MDASVDLIDRSAPGKTTRGNSARAVIKRLFLGGAFLAAIAAASDYGYGYWTVGRFMESTDDAYVKADFTTVAPKVSGYIAEVLVGDNQAVEAGQILARIDDRDLRAVLDQARADAAATNATIHNLDAQTVLQHSVIEQERANIAAAAAATVLAQADRERYRDLMRRGSGTVQRAEQAEAALRERTAELDHDRAALAAAEARIDVLATERLRAVALCDRAEATVRQAQLNLSYATIVAPVSGTVGARSLRIGQYVQAGTQLMAVVPLDAVYVVANYKETQLTRVHSGQPVEIRIDGFPDTPLTGQVDSLSPASGLEFSLLPPDNATGNFTKIVQRIPVRIVLDRNALSGLLRSGMSVEPTIDTRQMTASEH